MKRRHGEVRSDGFIFWGYRKNRITALPEEVWRSPEAYERCMENVRKHRRIKVARLKSDAVFRAETTKKIRDWHHEDYRRHMFYRCKDKALLKGLPFNLDSYEDIPYSKFCPVFGVELKISGGIYSPSIDRIIPELGYTKGNVIVVSLLANTIKSNATPDQILTVGKFYAKLFKKLGK